MSYKIEKKDGGWVVGGERFATQERATRHLIALLSGAESPAPKPSRPSSAPPRPRPSAAPPRPRPSSAPPRPAPAPAPAAGKVPMLVPPENRGGRTIIGYWTAPNYEAEYREAKRYGHPLPPRYPDPHDFVDTHWSAKERNLVVDYLDDEQFWAPSNKGLSFCRICHRMNGGGNQRDDTYEWPSGFSHYLTAHGVKPPQVFIDHVLSRLRKVRSRPSAATPRPRPSGTKAVRPRNEEEIFFHPFRVLGGGLLETAGGEGVKQRPLVVVEVAPGKARAFYMSTGTGGQTAEGEWNLFGGIAAGGYGAHLGWFIKPVEGKRVEKYSDVAAFLTEKFGSSVDPAWKVIRLSVPGARVFSELVDGKAPERSVRDEMTRKMGSRLNKYLADLGAIEKHTDYEAEVGVRDRPPVGGHATVFRHRRVAFNPGRW